MILDRLETSDMYDALGPRFAAGFAWLRRHAAELATMDLGRHEIADGVFALLQENMTKPPAECRPESHRTYADIQYVISGVERMACAPLAPMTVTQAYDPATDVAFYAACPAAEVAVPAGAFAVFFPQDVHTPLLYEGSPARVRKVVVKVAVSPTEPTVNVPASAGGV